MIEFYLAIYKYKIHLSLINQPNLHLSLLKFTTSPQLSFILHILSLAEKSLNKLVITKIEDISKVKGDLFYR